MECYPPSSLLECRGSLINPPHDVHDSLTEAILGQLHVSPQEGHSESPNNPHSADTAEAYANCNLLTDISLTQDSEEEQDAPSTSGHSVQSILKGLQPNREKPSKDRSMRFATGEMALDKEIPPEHDIITHQFWAVLSTDALVQVAKVFLLSQIIYISRC